MLQRKNTHNRELHSIICATAVGEKNDSNVHFSILPPSKLSAGRRLIKAKKIDEIINIAICPCIFSPALNKKINAIAADKMLAIGPAAASIASFLYVQVNGESFMIAPNKLRFISFMFILKVYAKMMCPSS